MRFKGKSIADVLDMTVNQAVEFFENIPNILRKIKVFQKMGLGYIKLGQPSSTLSGGESQRVKLATELAKKETGKTLFILDEPTTGLHFEDIRILLGVINKLVEKGNTVIVIEHNMDIIKCADWFVEGCSNLAKSVGIPSLIIGLTIVGFGTSAPETAVSVTASLQGINDISIGNVVGSNIFNLLFILGICSFFGKLKSNKEIIKRDFLYAILACIVMFILSIGFFINGEKNGIITATNGCILLIFLIVYLYILIIDAVKSSKQKEEKIKFNFKNIFFIIIGLAGIILGGKIVVNSAIDIANIFNVSQTVIALTIVSIGTSLPELVTSLVATKKGEVDIAIGNVVGSNIYNVFFILGVASMINPLTFGFESFIDIIVMLIGTIGTYILIFKDKNINKNKGFVLLITYILYMVYILMR